MKTKLHIKNHLKAMVRSGDKKRCASNVMSYLEPKKGLKSHVDSVLEDMLTGKHENFSACLSDCVEKIVSFEPAPELWAQWRKEAEIDVHGLKILKSRFRYIRNQ